ncbi:hypothetical protein FS837_011089 [Tulasnella sp. UAMH 9824]|nr:hypothetical protein FS837_011089 [Tulasnella sp. UAMH 9824]
MSVQRGDILVIPAPNDNNKNDNNRLDIHWSQSWRSRDGAYYVVIARNKSKDYAEVPFYIQSEWYNEPGFDSAYNMDRVDDDNYEIVIDDRHQYGGADNHRFVVWHDKERKPYADRFVQESLLKKGTDLTKRVFEAMNLGWTPNAAMATWAGEFAQKVVGEYLNTF